MIRRGLSSLRAGGPTRPSVGSVFDVRVSMERSRLVPVTPVRPQLAELEPRLNGRYLHHSVEEEQETREGSTAASRLLRDEDDGEDYMMAAEEELTHFRLCPRRWAGPERRSVTCTEAGLGQN